MSRKLRQTIAIAFLGLCLAGASASVAKQAAANPHACCPERSAPTTPAPCNGLLPLSCCDASAPPPAEQRVATHAPPALVVSNPVPLHTALAFAPPFAAPSAPRLLPARFSTVLQL